MTGLQNNRTHNREGTSHCTPSYDPVAHLAPCEVPPDHLDDVRVRGDVACLLELLKLIDMVEGWDGLATEG